MNHSFKVEDPMSLYLGLLLSLQYQYFVRMFCHDCSEVWTKLVCKLIGLAAGVHTDVKHLDRTRIGLFLTETKKALPVSSALATSLSVVLVSLRQIVKNARPQSAVSASSSMSGSSFSKALPTVKKWAFQEQFLGGLAAKRNSRPCHDWCFIGVVSAGLMLHRSRQHVGSPLISVWCFIGRKMCALIRLLPHLDRNAMHSIYFTFLSHRADCSHKNNWFCQQVRWMGLLCISLFHCISHRVLLTMIYWSIIL